MQIFTISATHYFAEPFECASNAAVEKERTSIITPILFWPTKVWYVASKNGAGVEFGVLFLRELSSVFWSLTTDVTVRI